MVTGDIQTQRQQSAIAITKLLFDEDPQPRSNTAVQLVKVIYAINTSQNPRQPALLEPVVVCAFSSDSKNDKIDIFENLFYTKFKFQLKVTEAMKVNSFHAQLRKETLQIFKNFYSTFITKFEETLVTSDINTLNHIQ